jgi:hypothetical protein
MTVADVHAPSDDVGRLRLEVAAARADVSRLRVAILDHLRRDFGPNYVTYLASPMNADEDSAALLHAALEGISSSPTGSRA